MNFILVLVISAVVVVFADVSSEEIEQFKQAEVKPTSEQLQDSMDLTAAMHENTLHRIKMAQARNEWYLTAELLNMTGDPLRNAIKQSISTQNIDVTLSAVEAQILLRALDATLSAAATYMKVQDESEDKTQALMDAHIESRTMKMMAVGQKLAGHYLESLLELTSCKADLKRLKPAFEGLRDTAQELAHMNKAIDQST